MWIILAGFATNIIITKILVKLETLVTLKDLTMSDHILGWFFLDHIPELYINSGIKYFLIDYNVRRLLTNCLIIIKNIFNLSYLNTITQYILLSTTYLYIQYLFILEFKFINVKKDLISLTNISILINFFILNRIFLELCTFSLNFFLIPILFVGEVLTNITFLVYFYIYIFLLLKVFFGKYFFVKSIAFLFQIFLNIYLIYNFFFLEATITNNFLKELCLKILILYNFLLIKLYAYIKQCRL
jgi:hypothetical protein